MILLKGREQHIFRTLLRRTHILRGFVLLFRFLRFVCLCLCAHVRVFQSGNLDKPSIFVYKISGIPCPLILA